MSATHAEMASWTHQELMTHTNPTGGDQLLVAELAPASAHVMLEIGLNQDLSLDPADWELTDITSFVLQDPAINYSRGRPDQRSRATPAKLSAVLLNTSGDFTPRKTDGQHYPYLRAGIPVRLGVNLDDGNGYRELWSGYLSSLVPGWDRSGKLPTAALLAGGVGERLAQGKTPLRSVMTRGIASGIGFDNTLWSVPHRYWPFEDADGATSASEYFGHDSITPVGSVTWGSDSTAAGSESLPTWAAGANFQADLSDYTPVGPPRQWRVEFMVTIPTTHSADSVIFKWTTTGGTATLWQAVWDEGPGNLILQAFDAGLNELLSDPGVTLDPAQIGKATLITVDAREVYSSGVLTGTMYQLWYSTDPSGTAAGTGGTASGMTLGKLATGYFTCAAGLDGMTFGHLAVFDKADQDFNLGEFVPQDYQYVNGYDQESAITRLRRVCLEQGIQLSANFVETIRLMGPQPVATVEAILAECEAVDMGMLVDGYGFGLRMFPASGRENAAQAFTLDVAGLYQLGAAPAPTEDNAQLRNDVTANRSGGGTGRFTQPTGEPYAPDGPGGVGTFDDTLTLNLFTDAPWLRHYAGHAVHLGTVDEDRYPTVTMDFAALATMGYASLLSTWVGSGVGSRFALVNLPPEASANAADLFVEDESTRISPFEWVTDSNCSPASPWDVGLVNTARVDTPTGGTTVRTATTTGSTSLVVDVVAGQLWTTSSAQYPFDLSVGGVHVTATGCSGGSTPQTFTLSAAIGQVVAAGLPVKLWTPATIGLEKVE